MRIKRNVVMLPTNEKAIIHSYMYKLGLRDKPLNTYQMNGNSQISYAQHLYILSDDEIKEGDWFMAISGIGRELNIPMQANKNGGYLNDHCKKIIATTDKSLETINSGVIKTENGHYGFTTLKPFEISQSFIKYFISEYNKGNIITEVMVEYDLQHGIKTSIEEIKQLREKGVWDNKLIDKILKINPDNTINIKPVEVKMYSREEVITIVRNNFNFVHKSDENETWMALNLNKWIEENI